MRVLLLLLVFIPFMANSQVNRSAAELARENAREYIKEKIFRNQPYTPVSYGDLKSYHGKNPDIAWVLSHRFEITEMEPGTDSASAVRRPYKFAIYLDRRMAVIRAESAYVE